MQFDHDESVEAVRDYFDRLAESEWTRLDADIAGRVSYQVHLHFLMRFIRRGMQVLEVGAGPGRFTIPLVEMGATVVVTDISEVQLELNEKHMSEAGVEHGVKGREILDVCDVSRYSDDTFDAVVAFGGPLSYAFDRANQALAGLLRVTRAEGPVVASVMSTLGAYRAFIDQVIEIGETHGEEANDRILATGDLRETQHPGSGLHVCRMFRSEEIEEMVENLGAKLLAMSASNWASLATAEALERKLDDPAGWETYVRREIWASSQPGAVDGGTHILFAASR